MTHRLIPIEGTHDHILKPIVQQIVNEFIKENNLQRIFGNNISILTNISNRKLTVRTLDNLNLEKNRLDAHVRSNINPNDLLVNNKNFINNSPRGTSRLDLKYEAPIFSDDQVGIKLTTNSKPFRVMVDMVLYLVDDVIAGSILSELIDRYGPDPYHDEKNVLFTTPIPTDLSLALHRLYQLRKAKLPDDMSFSKYLKQGVGGGISFLVKKSDASKKQLVAGKADYCFPCTISIQNSDFDVEKVNLSVLKQTITVSLDMQLSRPSRYALEFPLVIDNKQVPSEIYPNIPETDKIEVDNCVRLGGIHNISTSSTRYPLYRNIVCDDWFCRSLRLIEEKKKAAVLFIGLFTLDEDESGNILEETTIPLKQLSDSKGRILNPIVYESMLLQGNDTITNKGIFNIKVFGNDMELDSRLLSIDTDLNLKINVTNRNAVYRVVLIENFSLRSLSPIYIPFILKHYKFFNTKLFKNIDYAIKKGYLVIKDDLVAIADDQLVVNNALYFNNNNGGLLYSELDKLHEGEEDYIPYSNFSQQYVYTEDGYPILFRLGDLHAFTFRFIATQK